MYFKVPFLPLSKLEGILKFRLAPNFICFFFFSDEIDIIPCMHCQEEHNNEKEDPFIIVSHKLGIKSWCIKPLFLFAYNKLIRSRIKGKKDYNLSGDFFLFLRHNTCTFYSKMVAYLILFSSYVGINSYIFLLVFEALWKLFSL